MQIYFGLQFDERVFPKETTSSGGTHYLGEQGLLNTLESHLGLSGHSTDIEHIRTEQFRQAIQRHAKTNQHAFYQKSFAADQLATASRLLLLRDELILAGWNFENLTNTPDRLKTILELEQIVQSTARGLAMGFADRFVKILKQLKHISLPFDCIICNEPIQLLPHYYKQLFEGLKTNGVIVKQLSKPTVETNSDLALFQKMLLREELPKDLRLKKDGSLFIIKSKRETNAAVFLAKLFKSNPSYRPLCIIPEKNRSLDNAVIQEGLPSFGILSASLARPSLQILKLAPAFLWYPIDPYKIMEFVSLSQKPLDNDLADLIAQLMAQSPGMKSDSWYAGINQFFKELEERSQEDPSINAKKIKEQYDFWFEQKRFDSSRTVPVKTVIKVFEYVQQWVVDELKEQHVKQSSLLVLGEQSKRIIDLLEALPDNENQLSNLELERIVRTIYKSSPVVFTETEQDHLPFVYHSSTVVDKTDHVLWWNFSSLEPVHFFSKWYKKELDYLLGMEVHITTPQDENRLLLWQRSRAILQTQKSLCLVIPDQVDGTAVFPHPLYDELQAVYDEALDSITHHVENSANDSSCLKTVFKLPNLESLDYRQLGKPQPFIQVSQKEQLTARDEETFTSLENLFYYPYQWVFRYKIKLRKSSILSIVKDVTLMGNLAHRFFEIFFSKKEVIDWSKTEVETWVDENAFRLLSKEGAVLLLYGREPERVAFINKVKYALWSLLTLIKNNGWEVESTEKGLGGRFSNTSIRGKADLVLSRGSEKMVVDLKWRGAARRKRVIQNEEDLQLVTYARLLEKNDHWAHTAYFIIDKGEAIARNNLAFKEINAVAPDRNAAEVNAEIWQQMEATYAWRMAQIHQGKIEIRTAQTYEEIDESYGDINDLLDMKDADAPFDDYRTLINLVE